MRLINTATGRFEEFIGRNVPKYAILSHTREEEEVSFSDMQKDGHQARKGFEKIRMTCKLATDAGIQYAWVDTCCIDKSSSAELTEAINSMYRWYQRSAICYAYLSDLSPSDSLKVALPSCRWFTRGWTLQELIAPSKMRFFRPFVDRQRLQAESLRQAFENHRHRHQGSATRTAPFLDRRRPANVVGSQERNHENRGPIIQASRSLWGPHAHDIRRRGEGI